jgi:DNA-binding transcriptional ArsR family regulator
MSIRIDRIMRALAHEKRIMILSWLRDPRVNFPPQKDGDLVTVGVCVLRIAEKLGVKQPTATQHLRVLADAELVVPTRTGKWTFYRRNESTIRELKNRIAKEI